MPSPHTPPYTTSTDHLADHLALIPLLVQRHMRLHQDRLVRNDGVYNDQCVGRAEGRRLLGAPPEAAAATWLDAMGVSEVDALDVRLAHARDHISARLAATALLDSPPSLPIEDLRALPGMDDRALSFLLIAAAPGLSIDIARLLPLAWADFTTRQPTVSFILELLGAPSASLADAAAALLSPDLPLTRFGLVRLDRHPQWPGRCPRLHMLASVPQSVLDLLSGHLTSQPRGDGWRALRPSADPSLIDADVVRTLTLRWRASQGQVGLCGPAGSGRHAIAAATLDALGESGIIIDVNFARASDAATLDAVADALRVALLLRRVPVISLREPALDEATASPLRDLFERFSLPTLWLARSATPIQRLSPSAACEAIALPSPERQRLLWERALHGLAPPPQLRSIAEEAVLCYQLSPKQIELAASSIRARPSTPKRLPLTCDVVLRAISHHLTHDLNAIATPVSVSVPLDHLVLTADARAQLSEILSFARHADTVLSSWGFASSTACNRGLSVLFSGPPGTGKTLAAGVIARELRRSLFRVDLSRVVDKYIGETEKNLNRVFTEAERAQAILLFDEADSLFAKRTEVKSSNDRYANLEVNFLLQRLDDFDGVSILTTNLSSSIDEAFKRRIRFKVDFPMPDTSMRASLWRQLIPPAAPLDPSIRWHLLADAFELSGGYLRNAVLRAAIRAAADGRPISERDLAEAARLECRELGVLIPSLAWDTPRR